MRPVGDHMCEDCGTPSLAPPVCLACLLARVRRALDRIEETELAVERTA